MNDTTPVASRLPSLTGLRFAAAFGVFGFHFVPYLNGQSHRAFGDVFALSNCGVSFFFILSGVVLTWSRKPHDTRRNFYQRRFARIYPDYFVTWLLTIGVIAFEGGTFYLHAAGLGLLLLQAWVPKLDIAQGWNGVSWTLSCEMFFYLVFPFIVGRIDRLRRPIALVPFLCLPTFAIGLFGLIRYQHSSPETLEWLQGICPPVRLCEFIIGIAIGFELRRGTLPKIQLWVAAVAFLAAYVVLQWAPLQWLIEPVLIPLLALIIIAAAQRDLAGERSVWRSHPLVLLGERSYAFYLIHQLILRVWAKADSHHLKAASGVDDVLWFFFLLAVSITAASLLFRYVEVPFERRLRGSAPARVELAADGNPALDAAT